ncbi:hypothetical protein HY26_04210 [Hyphomonas sp. GM-8P]|nr:hypothetical protein HY26_04210 [Hyphomonas sp. GM-8P]
MFETNIAIIDGRLYTVFFDFNAYGFRPRNYFVACRNWFAFDLGKYKL